MISADLKSIIEVLKAMAEAELAISRFYRVNEQVIEEDKEFWLRLKKQEVQHMRNISKMASIISRKPERFEKGRNFNVVAIKTFISGIEDNIQRLQTGDLPKKNVIFIARNIEDSILENKIHELVKTDDVEYQTLAKNIVLETEYHRKEINNKIKKLEASGK